MELKEQREFIINTLSDEIADIINSNIDYYNGYEVIISEEQYFFKEADRAPGKIYIVVKFLEGDINFKQIIQPINIQAIAEQDKLEVCQELLYQFSVKYNLNWNSEQTIRQFYTSPYVLSNFNEVFEGFRSLLYISGTFLITSNANNSKVYYYPVKEVDSLTTNSIVLSNLEIIDSNAFFNEVQKLTETGFDEFVAKYDFEYRDNKSWFLTYEKSVGQIITMFALDLKTKSLENFGIKYSKNPSVGDKITVYIKDIEEEIDCLTLRTNCDITLDSQPFYSSDGYTKSVGKFGTRTMNFVTYLIDNQFLNKCLDVYTSQMDYAPSGVNTNFRLKVKFKNGRKFENDFKLVNFSLLKQVGELEIVSLTFAM